MSSETDSLAVPGIRPMESNNSVWVVWSRDRRALLELVLVYEKACVMNGRTVMAGIRRINLLPEIICSVPLLQSLVTLAIVNCLPIPYSLRYRQDQDQSADRYS